jgi:urea carboxylase-associated protein 2
MSATESDRASQTAPGTASESAHETQRPELLLSEQLRGGQMWSRVLRRGQRLRLTDVEGGAAVAALFFNADDPSERYNMPDTLKAQQIARLTQGCVLYSDMGRVLCSIVADSVGWHDTITGHGTREHNLQRYGAGSYQQLRNDFFRNSRDNLLIELGKYDLGKRDLVANVNFFVMVSPQPDGTLYWVDENSTAGSYVELRAELNTLIVLSNTPHPLDTRFSYAPPPVALEVLAGALPGEDDLCRRACPENERGFRLTEAYFA